MHVKLPAKIFKLVVVLIFDAWGHGWTQSNVEVSTLIIFIFSFWLLWKSNLGLSHAKLMIYNGDHYGSGVIQRFISLIMNVFSQRRSFYSVSWHSGPRIPKCSTKLHYLRAYKGKTHKATYCLPLCNLRQAHILTYFLFTFN